MSIAAEQLRRVREVRLYGMRPEEFEKAVRKLRRLQLAEIRTHNGNERHCARAEDRSACTGGFLLGCLIAALGFDPVANDPAEVEAGIAPALCRRYIGIEQ
jgi:hypothetical protein